MKRLKEIYSEVSDLDYSDESIVELITLVNEALSIAKKDEVDSAQTLCYKHLFQTYEKTIKPLTKLGLDITERKSRFKTAVSEFKTDLSMWCHCLK